MVGTRPPGGRGGWLGRRFVVIAQTVVVVVVLASAMEVTIEGTVTVRGCYSAFSTISWPALR